MEFHCPTCDKAFNTAEECQLHWVSDDAQDEQHHKTPECCKPFLTRATRATHMRDTRYHNICDHCGHDFRQEEEVYQFHRYMLAFSTQVQIKTQYCVKCNIAFNSTEELLQHIEDINAHF
ncbi:hypothetical protein F5Y02DRAFT_372252 [Annulohypoxylon stygium]|nr:hypothetical protein F5Y02DRAFT_372252 [Annulohypoxylon stygium]